MNPNDRLQHGGRLKEISSASKIPLEDWLDVSTGISPWSWPIPPIPESVWRELPNDRDELENIAQNYYRESSLPLAIPGSQWLIRHLPAQLTGSKTVAIPLRGYQEHHKSWLLNGNSLEFYKQHKDLLEKLQHNTDINTVVLINPNNPTAEHYTTEQCDYIADICNSRGGILIIDQAFADCQTNFSSNKFALNEKQLPNNNIIRSYSLGKFFGLAGLRLGFAFGPSYLIEKLRFQCEPWAVNGPARHIAKLSLNDHSWHCKQKKRIQLSNKTLLNILQRTKEQLTAPLQPISLHNGGLFISLSAEHQLIERLYQLLLQQGVYSRIFSPIENRNMLRFGLATKDGLAILEDRLVTISKKM